MRDATSRLPTTPWIREGCCCKQDAVARVRDALDELPVDFREVIVLREAPCARPSCRLFFSAFSSSELAQLNRERIVSPWTGHSFVPYAAGGVSGLTMFERPRPEQPMGH